jgi:uncharacterized protein
MLILFAIGIAVGAFGALLGLGGGILLIPLITTFLGVPIKTAIGTSALCVVATSSAAGAVYVGRGLTHNRLAMVLEVATTAGALAGGITAVLISPNLLALFFGLILIYAAVNMRKLSKEDTTIIATGVLDTSYVDPQTGNEVRYGVRNLPAGMGASFFAGNISGLLGIGGGIVKVPIMSLIMGVPLRASIATSNFMIGITAATSAIIYYARGLIDPTIAVPTALGVFAGAQIGTRLGGRLKSEKLKLVFQLVMLIFAINMFYQALRG